ncbi:MAG: 50S ribosomal protein L3 N(5)-glutamine methyltransferase [Burkholderiales bacterium]|jgi:ribosomal protein L3 glutamine methyltransferase|nr:50S ribosomal protein L3 N(5)-glutamine methyltransferase [Burkholderiales bacterium]
MDNKLHTIRDWLRWSVTRFNQEELFFGHGSDNAFDEAAYLISHALKLPLERLDVFFDACLTIAEKERVQKMLELRIDKRLPAAYLTNEAWLGDFCFYVDERVIVPRSFIFELYPDGLNAFLPDHDAVQNVLELCTGSGCLAIMAAHAYPNAKIIATDISLDALTVAQRNISDYGLTDRVTLIHSDLFANVPADLRCDLIIGNPPYVTDRDLSALPPEYRHEPCLALAGGEDGMDIVRNLINDARRFLRPQGILVMEIGHNRAYAEAAFPDLPFLWLETSTSSDSVFLLHREELP